MLNKVVFVYNVEIRKLDIDKFIIFLVNNCGCFECECGQMDYFGVCKSDNSMIFLKGKMFQDFIGKIIGLIYKNGDVIYIVIYVLLKLVVSKGGYILVEQLGYWFE